VLKLGFDVSRHQDKILDFITINSPFSELPKSQITKKEEILNEKLNLFKSTNSTFSAFLSMMGLTHEFSQINKTPPWLPVDYYKIDREHNLDISSKIIQSSGTGESGVSKVGIDQFTAKIQVVTLQKILNDFVGVERVPMLIVDKAINQKNRISMSASQIASIGLSYKASSVEYAISESGDLDVAIVNSFIQRNINQKFIIFGFTFNLYRHLVLNDLVTKWNAPKGIIVHGGGWKKLDSARISRQKFKEILKYKFNVCQVHDYYGMAEQTGSIYVECEQSKFHVSNYSDLLVLDSNFKPCRIGQTGLIQTISLIPYTYPGFSILTLDLGYLDGDDVCLCGRKGKTFQVLGRINKAQIRGCSDS
jgi:hypothetical protein